MFIIIYLINLGESKTFFFWESKITFSFQLILLLYATWLEQLILKLYYSMIDFSMHKTTISLVLKKVAVKSYEYCIQVNFFGSQFSGNVYYWKAF